MENNKKSTYLSFLPDIYTGGPEENDFFSRQLKIFEKLLTGINDTATVNGQEIRGISETLDTISKYFYPYQGTSNDTEITPAEFLDWLSSWVSLILKEDWDEEKKRKVIAKIIPLYRMRGTRIGLEEYLNIYTNGGVKIYDDTGLFQVEVNSKIDVGTAIDIVNYFIVEITLSESEQGLEAIERKKRIIETIIEKEKPIHTYYTLKWPNIKSLQIEYQSTIEKDTLLWSYQ